MSAQFMSMVKLQFNSKIKAVQTDWGGKSCPFTQVSVSLVYLNLDISFTNFQGFVQIDIQKKIVS